LVDLGFLGVGQVRQLVQITDDGGRQLWFTGLGRWGFAFPRDFELSTIRSRELHGPLRVDEGKPVVPMYLLTDEGFALSRILPDHEDQAFNRYLDELRRFAPSLPIRGYETAGSELWKPTFEVPIEPEQSR
jgi:hypothetical protein